MPAFLAFVIAGIPGASPADAQGARTERFFDDWNVLCVENEEGEVQCNMRQLHVTSEPRRNVFRWIVGRATEGEYADRLVNVFQAPLGVSLPEGIQIVPPNGDSFTVSFEVCGSTWCQGRMPLTDQMAESLGDGPVGIRYQSTGGDPVRTEATLRGFRQALQYLLSQDG